MHEKLLHMCHKNIRMNKNVLNSRVYKSKTNKKMPTRVYIRINCGIHNMEYYAAVKANELQGHRVWKNPNR